MADSKKFLVYHPDCGYCKPLKESLKDKIESGEIGLIDASTDEGYKIAHEAGVKSVPECLEKDGEGHYKACLLSDLTGEKGS